MVKHIIIIGSGLGGPCLALSLARRGINSTIYEIRDTPSLSGGSISLSSNALRILDEYCGVLKELQDTGFSYRHIGVYTEQGEKLGVVQAGDVEDKKDGYPALRIMRCELQKVLINACEESGRVKVKYGMKVKNIDGQAGIEEEAFGVRVQFEDGSEDHGDLLVGADGIHSQIRDYVLGSNAVKPTYDGICVVNGFIPSNKLSIPEGFTLPLFVFAKTGIFMGIPINHDASTIAWGINITLPDRNRQEWAEFEKSGEAGRVAKKDYENLDIKLLKDMLNLAKEQETKIWSTYSIGEIPTWSTAKNGKGRVVLMGDAAHGMPPNGLGSTMAFEDAATLCRLISENTNDNDGDVNTTEWGVEQERKGRGVKQNEEEKFKAIVERYEEIRRPRVKKIELGGKGARNARSKSGDWIWWVKKLVFRAFFWWKGGVVVHVADGGFDIDTIDVKV